MAALEDDCERDTVKLWFGGEEFGKILFFFKERGFCP